MHAEPAEDRDAPTAGQIPDRTCFPAGLPVSARLAALAEQIRQLYPHGSQSLSRCPSGLAALDAALGGGFARGAIHEILAPGGSAAARSVALLTATRAADRHRWIFYIDTRQDFYPPGAAQLGVPLEHLLVIRAPHPLDALWTCEQSLRCRSVAAVVLPLRSLDVYISRRLQLAAETGGNLGLLICSDAGGATFAASRLRLDPLVGSTRVRRLRVSILKLREGRPGAPFVLELPDATEAAPLPTLAPRASPQPHHAARPAG